MRIYGSTYPNPSHMFKTCHRISQQPYESRIKIRIGDDMSVKLIAYLRICKQ